MSILADPMFTEVVNGAFILAIGIGIKTVWSLNARVSALETTGPHLLTKEDFRDEMNNFRRELKAREDDIIGRVQWTLERFKE